MSKTFHFKRNANQQNALGRRAPKFKHRTEPRGGSQREDWEDDWDDHDHDHEY